MEFADRLQHLLAHTPLSAVRLQQAPPAPLASLSANRSAGLVPDDTHKPRNSNAVGEASWHHDGQQLINGVCAVTAMLRVGAQRLCFAIRDCRPKAHCPQEAFRSKIDLV